MAKGPQNAIVGDTSFMTEIPRTELPDELSDDLKRRAKFAKSPEFQVLKRSLEQRIAAQQVSLPGGQPVENVDPKVVGPMWIAAAIIIKEYQNLIAFYDRAAEAVAKANATPRQ